ncbi:MAG TPA: energy transducer TonB [Acidobacteriaceae bacterium]|jgi:TonB family protein
MAQPLRSEDPTPKDVQFRHFGVLQDGTRSKGAAATSVTLNIVILLVAIILGAVAKTNHVVAKKLAELTLPTEPPKVTPKPPPPPKPLPPVPKVEPPKIQPPKIKMPEPEKLPEMKPVVVPTPKPVVLAPPAPPKVVNPTPAPKAVSIKNMAASVVNNDAHPTAVRLGQPDSPLKPLTGPAVSRVNMGVAGMPGMNAANTGNGPRATHVSLGSGNPNGTDINGHGSGAPVAGVKLGCSGCTGPMNSTNYSNAPRQVQLQTAPVPVAVRQPEVRTAVMASPPKVTYKPTPSYTEEAKSLHLEGAVSVKIKVLSSGAVEVVSVTHGLGHGLDQSAIHAIQATRFQPAKDSTGRPIDWEGVVNVNFQLS